MPGRCAAVATSLLIHCILIEAENDGGDGAVVADSRKSGHTGSGAW